MSIITISREMAAGALPIAQLAAEELGYTLVDGQRVRELAPQYGLAPEDIDLADEKPPAFVETLDQQLMLTLHQIEMIVLDQARQGDVIIHGRAGRDVLLNMDNIFRVRIIAPFEERVERLAEEEWIDPEVAWQLVRKSDQQRAGFMKYYFDRDWTDPLSYDLVINTSRMDEETAARLLVEGVKCTEFAGHQQELHSALENLLVRKKIQIAFLQNGQSGGIPFDLSVRQGLITLTGNIYTPDQRRAVLAAVKAVTSEHRVDDRLQMVERRPTMPVE